MNYKIIRPPHDKNFNTNNIDKYFHITSTNISEFFESYDAVDVDGWTIKFVEKKENGTFGIADELIQIGETVLPEASIYPVTQIEQSGFMVEEISSEHFTRVWDEAIEYARKNKLRPVLTGVIYD